MLPSFEMGLAIKLSDDLALEARVSGEAMHRSLSGQIEFWSRLGKAVERRLGSHALLSLRGAGETTIAASLDRIEAESRTSFGSEKTQAYLKEGPFPRFVKSDRTGFLIKIDADGTETEGRFIHRRFVAVPDCAG